MTPYTKVRITKLEALPEGRVDPHGGRTDGPIFVGYTVEGTLVREPILGSAVVVLRTKSNGVEVDGIFKTSAITAINVDGHEFTTLNSRYRIEEIP